MFRLISAKRTSPDLCLFACCPVAISLGNLRHIQTNQNQIVLHSKLDHVLFPALGTVYMFVLRAVLDFFFFFLCSDWISSPYFFVAQISLMFLVYVFFVENLPLTFPKNTSCKFSAIFNLVSKVIRDCFDFTYLCSVIGPENSYHPLNQSDAKLTTIATWS